MRAVTGASLAAALRAARRPRGRRAGRAPGRCRARSCSRASWRSSTPRRSSGARGGELMPQPNMQPDAQAGPEDAGGHGGRPGAAQARGGRGLGRRRHGHGQGQRRPRVKAITIDPDAIDPDDAELLQDMVLAAVNEGLRSAQELAATKMGGLDRRAGRARGPRALRGCSGSQPDERVRAADPAADHRARQAARHRRAHRPAAGLPHPARRAERGATRSPTRSARSRSRSGCARSASTSPTAPRCADLPRRAPRRRADLRRRGAR